MDNPQRTLMALLAHPDDEVFGSGGTFALEAERGTRIILVVATGGEAGEVVNQELQGTVDLADLPAIRQQELRCSATALRVHEVVNLGYRDSGMAGAADNERQDAFMQADDDEIACRLVSLIRQYRPQILLAFDETGGYGHPDHLTIHRTTHLAFQRAGNADCYPGTGEPWQPARLFYPTLVREQLVNAYRELKRQGITMDVGLQPVTEDDLRQFGRPREEVTTVVNIERTVSNKIRAFRCYATQIPSNFFYFQVPEELLHEEYFTQGASAIPGPPPEHDLFSGITTESA